MTTPDVPDLKTNRQQKRHFEFMCRIHDEVLELATRLAFDKRHPWHCNLICLYGTMLALLGSARAIIREGIAVGVPILLRSAVEANLDFVNLAKARRYGYHMEAADVDAWIRIFREAEGGNPFLKDIAGMPRLKELQSKYEARLVELKRKGFPILSQKDKFSKAGNDWAYGSVYNFLCCESHNNIRAFVGRHIDISPGGEDFSMEIYRSIDWARLIPYIDTFCGITMTSTETIHKVLQSNAMQQVEELKQEFNERRRSVASWLKVKDRVK